MAKRVNKKFLLGLTIIVVGLAGALMVVVYVSRHRNPAPYIAAGDRAMKDGRYEEAAESYHRAAGLDRGNSGLLLKYGDALDHLVSTDPQYLGRAREVWQNILVIDPLNLPALQRLIQSYQDELDAEGAHPSPSSFTNLRDASLKYLKTDPSNPQAQANPDVAMIRQYLAGIATEPKKVDESVEALLALLKKDPGNSDALFYGVIGKLRRATDRVKNGDVDVMDKALADSTPIIGDALQAKPDNAALQWRAAQLYSYRASINPKDAEHDNALASASADRALSLVQPGDPKYAQIVAAAVGSAMAAKDTARAEKIVRQYYANSPNDAQAELTLGQFLRSIPGKGDEAMTVLSKPISAAGLEGFHALTARSIEAERIYLLSMMQAESYAGTADPARRKLLLDQMQMGLKSLEEMSGTESMAQLRLKARIHEIKGEGIEAMATYQRALNLMERNGVKDYDVMNDAARLDMQLGQTGSALKLLTQIVDYNSNYMPARLYLAQLYLQQDDPDSAEQQLDAVQKVAPQTPDLPKLRIAQLTQQKKPDAAKGVYNKLPESTPLERLAKAQLALQSKDYLESIRLLEIARKDAPDNVSVMLALAQSYAVRDQKEKARDVISEALKTNPNERRLLILEKQLENATPAELEKLNEQLRAGADDYTREIQEYQLAASHGKPDEALKHLQAADKLKPDDKLVAQLYFEFYLNQGKFDLAKQEIPTLVRLKGDESDGWISRARLAMARGDFDEAVKAGKEIVSRRPEFAVSYVLLGQAYLKDDKPDDAVREFQFALDRQSTNFDALKGLVDAFFANKQPDEAGKRIAEGRKLYPDSSQFRELALNYDLIYSNHPETAVEERAKILSAGPEQIGNYLAMAQADVRVAQLKAASDPDASKKYSSDAKDVLAKADAKWPGEIRIVGLLAQLQQYLGQGADGEKLLLNLAQKPEWKDKPDVYRLLADYYQRAGSLPTAEKHLRTAYEKSDKSVDVELALASLLLRESKFDDAMKVLSDNPSDPRVIRLRVGSFAAAGKLDEAERATKEALAASPNSMELLNLLTGVYLDANRPADARVAASNALKVDRGNELALFQQAKTEIISPIPDTELAIRDLNAAKEHNPGFIPARLLLAQFLQRRGDANAAIRELEDAVQVSPLNRDARLTLLNAYASARPPRWEQYDRVVAAAEADPQSREDPIWLQRDAGALAVRKQFPQAIQKIRAAVKLNPDNAQLTSNYLLLLVDSGDYQGALQETDKLLAAGKKDWWIYYASGMAKAGAGDKTAGLADLDKAIAVGDAANDGTAAARVLTEMASKVSFDDAVQRAAKRAKEDSAWRLFVLQLYRNKADWPDAVKTAEAINADKSNLSTSAQIVVADTLAAGYQSLGQFDKSRQAYMSWLELAPSDPVPLNNLAYMLAETLHQPTQAKVYSQKALQLVEKSGGDVNSVRDTHGWILTLCGGHDAQAGLKLLQQVVEENENFIEGRYHLGEAYLRSAQPDADSAEAQFTAASALAKAIEAGHGQVSPDIKTGIQEGLEKVRQMRSAKSEAAK